MMSHFWINCDNSDSCDKVRKDPRLIQTPCKAINETSLKSTKHKIMRLTSHFPVTFGQTYDVFDCVLCLQGFLVQYNATLARLQY
jgi:hypothetical protein